MTTNKKGKGKWAIEKSALKQGGGGYGNIVLHTEEGGTFSA